MDFRLGKQEYVHDPRTLKLASFLSVPSVPDTFDFDKGRTKLPLHMWGNDVYGDCVLAGQANCLIRLERIETHTTLKSLTDEAVVKKYKQLTGCTSPGDQNDSGLVVLDSLGEWRHNGWPLKHAYTIDAYGQIDVADFPSLHAGCYLLGGIHFGFRLPITARDQIHAGKPWDVVAGAGADSKPGSWGGHLVFAKRYAPGIFPCLTWGKEQVMTDAFIEKYSDEAWAVVDSLDRWRKNDHLDVQGMIDKLRSVGARNIG